MVASSEDYRTKGKVTGFEKRAKALSDYAHSLDTSQPDFNATLQSLAEQTGVKIVVTDLNLDTIIFRAAPDKDKK